MKVAVSGKGGVGKTTLSACMARFLAEQGRPVIAIDADPDTNLATALGVPDPESITPIAEMRDLIAERTESQGDNYGKFFKLNPRVSDIPERFVREHAGVKLLVMGTVRQGGGGCACPENVFLKTLLGHLVLVGKETVILDMVAGIEHLGRGTAEGVDALIVVVEPGLRSIETALRVRQLAADIGVNRVFLVGNKVRSEAQADFVREHGQGLTFLGMIAFDECIGQADLEGVSPYDACPFLRQSVESVWKELTRQIGDSSTN
jgi:CO dehydrogenase maturation factor